MKRIYLFVTVVLLLAALGGCTSTKKTGPGYVVAIEEKPQQKKETVVGSSYPRRLISEPKKAAFETPEEAIAASKEAAFQEPQRDDFIYGMTVYDFIDYTLYKIYCSPGHVTDIILAPGEDLIDISAGDTVRWQVNSSMSGQGDEERVHVLIKPLKPNLSNNIVILTNLHTYHLEAASTEETYQSAVSWNYPKSFLRKAKKKTVQQANATLIKDASNLEFNYEIKDSRSWWKRKFGRQIKWKPVRVFDDGNKTFIQFPPDLKSTEAPALFVVSPEGSTQLVNYRLSGSYYIVDRLFERAKLVVGEKDPTVVKIKRKS